MASYISYNDPSVEPAVANEANKIESVIKSINQMQDKNFAQHRHAFRGTHVKTQGIVKGGKSYPVALRFANEPSFLQDDRAPGPRGLGMKVFDLDGDFLDAVGERTKTQDFTFNNAPLLELTDLPTTVEILDLRNRNFDDKENLEKELSKRDDTDLQFAPAGLPNQHFLSYTMYSQSAYRYGDYVCKYALFPSTKLQQDLEKMKITDDSASDQHSAWLQEYFRENDAEYDFRVQLLRDLEQQPVEDCSKEWDAEKFPFETVGKVKISAGQDCFSPARRTFWEDKMKLNVWYGLAAHRPLGSVNRLRKALYQASAKKREAMNAVAVVEVSSVDQIP